MNQDGNECMVKATSIKNHGKLLPTLPTGSTEDLTTTGAQHHLKMLQYIDRVQKYTVGHFVEDFYIFEVFR